MAELQVLISGSGIAGSAFAYWLLRANRNVHITIVERSHALRLTGASVDIRGAGVDIIKAMNLEQDIRRLSTKEAGVAMVREDDSPIVQLLATGDTDMQSFTSEYEIFRGALTKLFVDNIKDKINLIFDDWIDASTLDQDDKGVSVTFAKSKHRERYDLVVAADGVWSKIRGRLLGAEPRDHIEDLGMRTAFFTINKDLLNGSKVARCYSTAGGKSILLRPDPDPAGKTRAVLMTVHPVGDERNRILDEAERKGHAAYMGLMDELYKDVGWMSSEVLKGMRESDDFYASQFCKTKSPILQKGRVALLGDAAGAMPGIGTSLAITAAYILAGELSKVKDVQEIGLALRRFEGIMLPHIQKEQQTPVRLTHSIMLPETWWGLKIRDTLLGLIEWTGLVGKLMRLMHFLGIKESKLALPEYDWLPAEEMKKRAG